MQPVRLEKEEKKKTLMECAGINETFTNLIEILRCELRQHSSSVSATADAAFWNEQDFPASSIESAELTSGLKK